jgi:hypothetical protein
MPDPENEEERFARAALERHGFEVIRLDATAERKRPDFLVKDGVDKYLVEVRRLTDPEQQAAAFRQGEVVSVSAPVGYDERLYSKARKKRKQITSEDPTGEMFHVLWFTPSGIFHEHREVADRVGDTMYGIAEVGLWGAGDPLPTVRCLYAKPSFFYRFREIDAVIVASERGGLALVNEFADGYDLFVESRLGATLRGTNTLVDPKEIAEREGVYRVDPALRFSDEKALEEHLAKVIGHPTVIVLNPQHHQSMVLVPDEPDQQ